MFLSHTKYMSKAVDLRTGFHTVYTQKIELQLENKIGFVLN